MKRILAALLVAATATSLVSIAPTPVAAQAVENPIAFDSAGRVTELTPSMVAQLRLQPPAWRITGDYSSARLFQLSDATYVIVVTRRNGVIERYAITREEREYLRARTADLPSGVEGQLRAGLRNLGATVDRETRNAFVRNQTLLGLGVYAPSFSYAVTNDPPGRVATYLLVAGGTFFGAATLTREVQITRPMNNLASLGALNAGAAGWGTAYALDASPDATGAAIFVTSLAGTAAGLYFGQGMSEAEVTAAHFGAYTTAATVGGLVAASVYDKHGDRDPDGMSSRTAIGIITAAGVLGYPLGSLYERSASYSITSGDLYALSTAGITGAALASAAVAGGDNQKATWVAATAGWVLGLVAGDRFLVRRYDHTRSEGTLLVVGAGAGALMGLGAAVLVDHDNTSNALLTGLGGLGAVAGVALTENYQQPKADATRAGRRSSSRWRFDPSGIALAAAGAPGVHPILGLTF